MMEREASALKGYLVWMPLVWHSQGLSNSTASDTTAFAVQCVWHAHVAALLLLAIHFKLHNRLTRMMDNDAENDMQSRRKTLAKIKAII